MRDHNHGHLLWLLDYSIVRTGTVIPQTRWIPENMTDRRQHVAEAILQMPIFFLQQDGGLGLSLDDAINGHCKTLRDARVHAQLGGKSTTYIRLGVCSYLAASYLCVKFTYDDAWCTSVARVRRIQAASPDPR